MIALKKRNQNKKLLLGLCALLVVAMVSVSLTLALTTVDKTYSTNVVAIGEVQIELIDNYYSSDKAANQQTYDETHPPVFTTNSYVHKTIKVKNIGKYPCYVRLLVRKEWLYEQASGSSMVHFDLDNPTGDLAEDAQTITWTVNSKWVRGRTPKKDTSGNFVYDNGDVVVENENIHFKNSDWDYCYYYQEILQPEGETDPLFVDNKFHIGNYDAAYGDKADGHIYVAAQAVQSDYTNDSTHHEFGDLLTQADQDKTFFTSGGKIVKWNNNLLFE